MAGIFWYDNTNDQNHDQTGGETCHATLGRQKRPVQTLIGFALETHNEENNALHKMTTKGLDMIVLNSLQDAGAGFACDTNKVTIYNKDGRKTAYPLETKQQVAKEIIQCIIHNT